MAYFDCIVGGSGKGNTLVVSCADDLAGATITCTNGTKTYTKTCPSTAPYEVTFYGLAAGTYTVSATVSGDTYTTTVVITDYEAELGGFNWKTWVDLSENYTSSDFTDLDDLLSDETAIRELMTIHDCVDYLAGIAAESAAVEKIIDNDLCAKWINNRDYALDTLYANEIIADYMDEADKYGYGEWVITDDTTTPPTWGAKGNIPVMTANNAPYGVASASASVSGREAYKCFSGGGISDPSIQWNASSANNYVQYEFVNPSKINRIDAIASGSSGGSRVKAFELRASNDGFTTYETLLSETMENEVGNPTLHTYTFDNDNYYKAYRVIVLSTYEEYVGFRYLQFYGRELSVSVPTMTGNTTPYGEVSYSSQQAVSGNYAAYNAFNTTTNWWISNYKISSSNPKEWIQYHFTEKMCPLKIAIGLKNDNTSNYATFKVLGSNDGFVSDIHELTNSISTTPGSADRPIETYDIASIGDYQDIRVEFTKGNYGYYIVVLSLQFYGLDYSEKEFEEGTTKKWLYDHGVELETLRLNTTGGTITKEDSEILLTNTSANPVIIGTENLLDTSSYNLLRCILGRTLLSGGSSRFGVLGISTAVAGEANVSSVAITSDYAPNNMGLDISSVNGNYSIVAYGATNGNKLSVKELWLE